MYRIIDSRGTGKTGRLLLLAKETGAIIACKHTASLIEKARAYGITGVDIISYTDIVLLPIEADTSSTRKILIDDLEEFAKFVIESGKTRNEFIGYNLSID